MHYSPSKNSVMLLILFFPLFNFLTAPCRPISAENVGRQMLEKMGWSEGEGLGREGAGRREPVSKNNLYANLRTYAKRGVNYLATMYEPLFQ